MRVYFRIQLKIYSVQVVGRVFKVIILINFVEDEVDRDPSMGR